MFTTNRILFGFISSGRDTKMYTFRQMHEGTVYVAGVGHLPAHKSFYIQNLSTDSKEAIRKAEEMCHEFGIPFSTDFDLDDLDVITRKTAEEKQLDEEEAQRQAAIRIQQSQFEQHNARIEQVSALPTDKFTKGAYETHDIQFVAERDPSYINFLLDTYPPLEGSQYYSSYMHAYVDIVVRPQVSHTPIPVSQHVGEEKQRIRDMKVVCERVSGFARDTPAGMVWVDRYIVRDENFNKFIIDYSGTSWDMEPLEEYVISGTVKYHSESERWGKSTGLTRVNAILASDYTPPTPKAPKSKQSPKKASKKVGGESKMDRARRIFRENMLELSRGAIIEMFMAELEMSKAGASTYYQKLNKEERDAQTED